VAILKIRVVKLTFESSRLLRTSDAKKIRGYLGNLFWDNRYVHQHNKDGTLMYRYPCVQYKVIDGSCVLIGFREALKIVKKTFHELKSINIDGQWEEIPAMALEGYEASFGLVKERICYTFLTPWLALNEKNYEKYQRIGSRAHREKLLEDILVGNILSMSKSLGYTVTEPIKAKTFDLREFQIRLKDVPMLGFLGRFSVNFEIPDYWGIGKSVSRGFGTVKKCSS